MSRLLIFVSNILFLGSFIYGCSSQSPRVSTDIPTVDLTPLTSDILYSDEINDSDFLKVDEGLEIADRSNCWSMDCAFNVWDIIQQEPLAFTDPNASLELAISLIRFQTPEEAISSALRISGNAGQPGFRFIEIPAKTLSEHSFAYAEDGRYVLLVTVHGNIQISVSISEFTWKINEPEKAGVFLADIAKMQVDKLMLSNNR
jgi:hypothetical protein